MIFHVFVAFGCMSVTSVYDSDCVSLPEIVDSGKPNITITDHLITHGEVHAVSLQSLACLVCMVVRSSYNSQHRCGLDNL